MPDNYTNPHDPARSERRNVSGDDLPAALPPYRPPLAKVDSGAASPTRGPFVFRLVGLDADGDYYDPDDAALPLVGSAVVHPMLDPVTDGDLVLVYPGDSSEEWHAVPLATEADDPLPPPPPPGTDGGPPVVCGEGDPGYDCDSLGPNGRCVRHIPASVDGEPVPGDVGAYATLEECIAAGCDGTLHGPGGDAILTYTRGIATTVCNPEIGPCAATVNLNPDLITNGVPPYTYAINFDPGGGLPYTTNPATITFPYDGTFLIGIVVTDSSTPPKTVTVVTSVTVIGCGTPPAPPPAPPPPPASTLAASIVLDDADLCIVPPAVFGGGPVALDITITPGVPPYMVQVYVNGVLVSTDFTTSTSVTTAVVIFGVLNEGYSVVVVVTEKGGGYVQSNTETGILVACA